MDIDIDIINSYQFVVGVVDCYGLIVLVPESINFGRILSHTLLPPSLPPPGFLNEMEWGGGKEGKILIRANLIDSSGSIRAGLIGPQTQFRLEK